MDLITPPTQAQKALFSTLATGTDFVLTVSPQKTLKAEFARLAKTKGWEGGSEEWNKYWHECFGEEYTYCGRRPIPSSPALSSTYSIIYTPSSTPANSECGGITLEDLSDSEGTVLVSKYWDKYPGYHQDPSAPLADAFNGLTLHMGWSPKSKKQRRRRGECYQEEFGTHFGTVADKLETWQALCGEVGIEPIPKSITQCKKALKGVLINLVNLIDHRRNPAIPLKKFASFNQFRRFTMNGNIFPKNEAKAEGFIKALLREVL